ncbi:MAG: hypothetical protein BZ138_03925 [Methanosphaera sp. rholeuAM270]|nr:MAG: hypothetical protein BZ138_03925 [Methanosphaera sp. rholeuAM270]
MNKKIISLCMILFILIICTTVNASEITNNTINDINDDIDENSNIEQIELTAQKSVKTKQIINSTDESTENIRQSVQETNDDNNIIKKLNKSDKKLNIKAGTVQVSTNLNITGIVTKAYDKENDTYAGDEEEGFAVNGAKIRLYDSTGKNIAKTVSNGEGKYQFLNLESGNYTIEFEYGTYAIGEEQANLHGQSIKVNHIFVPDIAIIAFSGDNSGSGQAEKIKYLKDISDRILFLESYELNNSYDNTGQWMLNYANFILVDMYSLGNGFGVDIDLVADSPASHNNKIAYCFGLFDNSILQGTLGRWGWLGGNPHSVENTYVGSYWQALSEANSTTIKINMKNLLSYIKYLLGESKINPTQNGNGPRLLSSSWGIYYPGYTGNVKTPSTNLIKTWIESNPGYNADGAGSLNWMTENYSRWNLENNDPAKILSNFENWFNVNRKELNSSFIVISTYYEGGKVVDALIEEYERQGRPAFSIYKTTSEDPDMTALLEIAGNKSVIKRGVVAVSYMYWWTTGYAQRGGNYTINAYKNLNVSLIDALKDISKFSFESEYGPQNEWTAAVTMPQLEGVFGSIPVSYLDDNKETVIIPEGVAKHVQLTNGWAKLRELNNSDKKVSIIFYGYPPGKANIGASYLDVFQSLHDLLEKLYDSGYDIGMERSEIPTTDELNAIISDFGNKGLWAEGLLDTYVIQHYDELTKYGQLVNEKTYNKWYKALPKTLQNELTGSWGSGLGNGSMIYREKVEVNLKDLTKWLNGLSESNQDQFKHFWNITDKKIVISKNSTAMVLNKTTFYRWLYDLPNDLQKVFNQSAGYSLLNETPYKNQGYFLIPGTFFGNIFISVQPLRGWESQIDFHNSYLPPPQQYVAYYKYLSEIFGTNAIIHMGTHGTLEWLPGRNLGLQSTDWPFQLIETPIIYPYIVSNPGEGMVAKERSFAQVLTHMTPVTSVTSLYGDYVELSDAISRYDSNKNTGVEENLEYYKSSILNLTENLGYDKPDYMKVQEYLDDYLIALNNNDTANIRKTKNALIQAASILNFDKPRAGKFDEWLTKLQKYLSSTGAFEEWLAIIHADLEALSVDKINSGMHTLGKVWNDTEMITGVSSIVSSRTQVLDDIMNLLYPEITISYYDKIKDRSFNSQKEVIQGVLTSIVTNLVEGKSVEEIAHNYGVYNESSALYQDIVEINDTIQKVLENMEWEYILTALDGGYVEPGLAADPLYSDVLPTGRAMYVSDTEKIPSKSAWQSAVNSVDQVLIKYMVDLGEETYPELVAEVIWGTEVLRTEGISLAQFMYLLGVKPVWDNTGKVTGVEVIPLEDLTLTIDGTVYNRPRIDVFATIVCNNPKLIGLLTDAIKQVNELNESFKDNYVKKHYNETGSLDRLFGLPGAILEGTGVADLLNQAGTTLNESAGISTELASVYESRLSHSWKLDADGNIMVQDDSETFSYLLEHVDLIIQNLDSTWRYLDSDDYLDWFGGLLNAANVHGNIVNTVLLDIRDKNNVVTNTLGEEVKRETRTTLLNPQWLNDMTSEVGGWNQMSMNFENLMKTMLTTQDYKENQAGKAVLDTSTGNNAGIIGDGLLRELARTVTYSDYFTIDAQYKSYAFQSMSGWLLTADMAGYWKTNDNVLRKDLLQKYVDNANRYGVACCHHTCGNINFHSWIIKTGASLGVKGLSEYSQIYASATKNPDAIYSDPSDSSATISADGTGTGDVDINEGLSEYMNNGATSEANAMAMAGAGASGLADSSSNSGNSLTMATVNNGGTGSGSSGNSAGTGDVGTNTGSGNGTENEASSNGSGSGTGEGTGQQANPAENNTQSEENSTATESNPSQTETNSADNSTQTQTNSQDGQNTTITENSDSGAGENPDTSNEASDPSNEISVNEVNAVEGSSAGGESGSSAGKEAVYEIVQKKLGKPPSSQSEIAIGYLLFIVLILVIFFIGFTKPNARK